MIQQVYVWVQVFVCLLVCLSYFSVFESGALFLPNCCILELIFLICIFKSIFPGLHRFLPGFHSFFLVFIAFFSLIYFWFPKFSSILSRDFIWFHRFFNCFDRNRLLKGPGRVSTFPVLLKHCPRVFTDVSMFFVDFSVVFILFCRVFIQSF